MSHHEKVLKGAAPATKKAAPEKKAAPATNGGLFPSVFSKVVSSGPYPIARKWQVRLTPNLPCVGSRTQNRKNFGCGHAARHCVDGRDHVPLRLSLRFESRGLMQSAGGKQGPGPGSEILCSEVLACDLAEVVVDVIGRHDSAFAFRVEVLKEVLSRKLFTFFDHARDPTQMLSVAPLIVIVEKA